MTKLGLGVVGGCAYWTGGPGLDPQHHNLKRDAQALLKRNLAVCQSVGSSRICPLLSGALLSYWSLMLSLTNNVHCVCTAAMNKSSRKEAAPAVADGRLELRLLWRVERFQVQSLIPSYLGLSSASWNGHLLSTSIRNRTSLWFLNRFFGMYK